MRVRPLILLPICFAPFVTSWLARAESPSQSTQVVARPVNGIQMVRILGSRAGTTLNPASNQVAALVAIPKGESARSLGIDEVSPGFGRIRGSVERIDSFANAHPNVALEVAPPLHTLLDQSGVWTNAVVARSTQNVDGTGVLVGVADTGLDVTHSDMLDENGASRVEWLLDLSRAPIGLHPELEDKFGIKDDSGKVTAGAVYSGSDITNIFLKMTRPPPEDEVGHGTHVTSIAAGNGGVGSRPHTPYVGMAPKAGIVFARITRNQSDSIENDDLVRGVQFLFDRADALKKPIAVNLSVGSDFGPHDGSMLWEQTLASFVGPDHPGRALIVAAGNSGSIAQSPIHQSVYVTKGSTTRVPVPTAGAKNGSIQIWITVRGNSSLDIGLDGPDGSWIDPVSPGDQRGKNTSSYNAGVINGSTVKDSPIPSTSNGAVVLWTGSWPSGTYNVVLRGEGTADLFLQATGDVAQGSTHTVSFAGGIREGTVNLPATHPSIIGVGCTVNRTKWTSIDQGEVPLHVPVLDDIGGMVRSPASSRLLEDGEVCWFSSAGPTTSGVPKPEISAPGGVVVAAMSNQAPPGSPNSIFSNPNCPKLKSTGVQDTRCFQVDPTHAVAVGTSMSAPIVAGIVALLFQRDPTLTQDKIIGLLQAGAHPFRGAAPFDDQGGPGEVDAVGSLDALTQVQSGNIYLPSAEHSWITLGAEYAAGDGSTPLTAIVELRSADGAHRADLFDASRLQSTVLIDGVEQHSSTMTRRAPGVWAFTVNPPRGRGGATMTLGATFDGAPICASKTIPIGTDAWTSTYATRAKGGCAVGRTGGGASDLKNHLLAVMLGAFIGGSLTFRRGRTKRSS